MQIPQKMKFRLAFLVSLVLNLSQVVQIQRQGKYCKLIEPCTEIFQRYRNRSIDVTETQSQIQRLLESDFMIPISSCPRLLNHIKTKAVQLSEHEDKLQEKSLRKTLKCLGVRQQTQRDWIYKEEDDDQLRQTRFVGEFILAQKLTKPTVSLGLKMKLSQGLHWLIQGLEPQEKVEILKQQMPRSRNDITFSFVVELAELLCSPREHIRQVGSQHPKFRYIQKIFSTKDKTEVLMKQIKGRRENGIDIEFINDLAQLLFDSMYVSVLNKLRLSFGNKPLNQVTTIAPGELMDNDKEEIMSQQKSQSANETDLEKLAKLIGYHEPVVQVEPVAQNEALNPGDNDPMAQQQCLSDTAQTCGDNDPKPGDN